MKKPTQKKVSPEVLKQLEKIFQAEMAGIVRYLHYSFMVMGHSRIPIQQWFRTQASEAMAHTVLVGEKLTSLGGHPPVVHATVEETNLHGVDTLLEESLRFEQDALALYKRLASLAARSGDVALEEMARQFVRDETEHVDEIVKMLRTQ